MITSRGKQSARERHLRQVKGNYRYLGLVYRPAQRYAGDLTLLLSEQLYAGRSAAAWQSLVTGRVEVLPVAGTHRTYLGQHLRSTAEQLQRCLQRAQLPSSSGTATDKS